MNEVSVIIPTWDRAATLGKAILSSLEQTHPPLEVLVCGVEGSPDKQIFDSISDSRMRWINVEHDGLAATPRNRGIQVSRGEWLAFLDSDDEWLPEKIEKQLTHANKMACDAACSDAIRYVPSEGYLGAMYKDNNLKESISFCKLIHNNYVICSSALIKKEVVDKCNGFPEDKKMIAVEDYALWLRVATFTDIAYVDEPLLIYRDEPETSLRAFSRPALEQRINVLKTFIPWAHQTEYLGDNKEYLGLAKKLLRHAQTENAKMRLKTIPSKIKSWIMR